MKRSSAASLALALAVPLVLFAFTALCLPAAVSGDRQIAAALRYVAPGGACGSVGPCFGSVQAAVDAAGPGDEIHVAMGVYTGVSARAGITQMVYLDKDVIIRGGYSTSDWSASYPQTQTTVLDAQSGGRVFYITGNISPTIQGLSMIRGQAYRLGGSKNGYDAGGAVYMRSTGGTLAGNAIMSSTSSLTTTAFHYGGGVYVYQGRATIAYNTIISNTGDTGVAISVEDSPSTIIGNIVTHNVGASGATGAIDLHTSAATVTGNNIISNTGGFAGGIHVYGGQGATITGNLISDNKAGFGAGITISADGVVVRGNTISGNHASFGGGMDIRHTEEGERVIVEENLIIGNDAAFGGGLYVGEGPMTLRRNIIRFNRSGFEGGGLVLTANGSPRLENNVVADNSTDYRGPGIFADSTDAALLHTTIARNSGADGAGIVLASQGSQHATLTLTNTIIAGQGRGITVSVGSTATVNGVLWWANAADTAGAGVLTVLNAFSGDPLFAADGYHIARRSAAVDRGINAGVGQDIDGGVRPAGAAPDLGADEYFPFVELYSVYMPVIMK